MAIAAYNNVYPSTKLIDKYAQPAYAEPTDGNHMVVTRLPKHTNLRRGKKIE